MAREDTATETATEDTATEGGEQAATESKPKKERTTFGVSLPPQLMEKVLAEGPVNGDKTKIAGFIRDELARKYGVTLMPVASRTKYNSPEEKKAAQKARREERNELVNRLLQEHFAKQGAGEPAVS